MLGEAKTQDLDIKKLTKKQSDHAGQISGTKRNKKVTVKDNGRHIRV